MKKDLTTGSPLRQIILFTMPLFLGRLLQNAMSFVSTVVMGRFEGLASLTAVSSTAPVIWLIVGFATSAAAGFGIPVARHYGANNPDGVRKSIGNTLTLTLIISLVISGLSMALTRPILQWMQTPEVYIDDAYDYLFVYFAATGLIMLFNVLCNVLCAVGSSKTQALFVTVLAILNLVFHVLYVGFLRLGARGAGLAIFSSYLVTDLCCIVFTVSRHREILPRRKELRLEWNITQGLLGAGMPMGIQGCFTSFAHIITQVTVNLCGPVAASAVASGKKVENLLTAIFFSLGTAMSVYAGQNIGAKRPDRIRKGVNASLIFGLAVSMIMGLIAITLGTPFSRLFVITDDMAVYDGIQAYLQAVSIGFFFFAVLMVLRNTIHGMGYSSIAMWAGIFELIAQVIISYLAYRHFGFQAVIYANTAAWGLSMLFLIPAYAVASRRMNTRQLKGAM